MNKKFQRLAAVLAAAILTLVLAVPAVAEEQPRLAPPEGVTINLGDNPADSADDTVSFQAVENAVGYKVYVYVDGSSDAKVTEGADTTLPLPSPLDAGEYLVFVQAVGDGQAFASSKASERIPYTVEEAVKEKLGQVSDIAMDFSQVDADNAKYPIISFTPVENAGRYLVDVYAANKDGEKQLTSLGYTTRFTVPGAQADGYMMDSTNYASLIPGYYVVAVTAYSNNSNYDNGDPAEAFIPWTNVEAIQPRAAVEEPENGGISAALENCEDYNEGVSVDVLVYADADCTELVKQAKITYTTSQSFGNITQNNSVGLQVKDSAEAGPGDLATGTEYYVVLSFDPELYTGNYQSEPVSFICSTPGDGSKSTGSGGGMGGGMGGGGGSMTIEPDKVEITFTAEEAPSVPISAMGNAVTLASEKTDPADGAEQSYILTGSGPMGEDISGYFNLMPDGTVTLHIGGFGPFSDCDTTGTWSADGDTFTMNWD